MMDGLDLSVGLVDSCDRTIPIVAGRVGVQGVRMLVSTTDPSDLFRRVVQFAEFDVAEMSVASFIALRSRGDERYSGIPVFPRRSFRHGAMYVNRESGIDQPRALEGRRVGVSEYQQTASVWIRGLLRDEYDVDTSRIDWYEGGLDQPDAAERLPLPLPEEISLRRLSAGENLSDMLLEGRLDAVIGPRRPRCIRERDPRVGRLIPDYRTVEQDYYRRTGFYPIMHMLVIRSALLERHPWLAANVYSAFEQAKDICEREWRAIADRSCSMPWLLSDVEELDEIFGEGEQAPYGFAANRKMLQKIVDMTTYDGLAGGQVTVEDLFAEELRGEAVVQFT